MPPNVIREGLTLMTFCWFRRSEVLPKEVKLENMADR